MIEFGDQFGFAFKARLEVSIVGEVGVQHFDSHPAFEVGIPSFIDGSHAAFADPLTNLIAIQPCAE